LENGFGFGFQTRHVSDLLPLFVIAPLFMHADDSVLVFIFIFLNYLIMEIASFCGRWEVLVILVFENAITLLISHLSFVNFFPGSPQSPRAVRP
jgi:hypothetical protein